MTDLPGDQGASTDVGIQELKQEPGREVQPIQPNQNANSNMIPRNINPQANSSPPMPSPFSFPNRFGMIGGVSPYGMNLPMDPIRTVLAFQSQENMAARRDASERQAQMSQVLMDVTKMLLKEQENNRNFQKEIIELFSSKLSEQSVLFGLLNPGLAALPSTPTSDSLPSTSSAPPPTAIPDQSKSNVTRITTAVRPVSSPYKKMPPQRVMVKRQMLGKGKDYNPVTMQYSAFACRYCQIETASREELIKHSEQSHRKI